MIDIIKTTLRVSTDAFDAEIQMLIDAAKGDLIAHGVNADSDGALVKVAIATYVRANFGNPPDADRLMESYRMQRLELSNMPAFMKEA